MTGEDVLRAARFVAKPLWAKLGAMVQPAVVKAVDDSKLLQTMKVAWVGDASEPVTHVQPGGITHTPLAGAEGILLRTVQGVQFLIGATNRTARPKAVAAGDTVVWSSTTSAGTSAAVHLTADGDIYITPYDSGAPVALAPRIFIGAPGAANTIALGSEVVNALTEITNWMDAVHAVLTGTPIAEPGVGSPSALQTALGLALAGPPPISPPSAGTITAVRSRHRIDG